MVWIYIKTLIKEWWNGIHTIDLISIWNKIFLSRYYLIKELRVSDNSYYYLKTFGYKTPKFQHFWSSKHHQKKKNGYHTPHGNI